MVTDASPLITLAAAEALDCLTMAGVRIVIPDLVYFEVTQDLAKTGADDIVQWTRRHPGQIEIMPTTVFAEFQALRLVNEKTRSRCRGEQSALEVLNAAIDDDPLLEAILVCEDNDIRKRGFVRGMPERVTALSTGDLLHELEAAGRIQSVDHILDRAAGRDRHVDGQRQPRATDADRAVLRAHLRDETSG
jgi:predicted nuclease of predicted toxin-antitoxin system